MSKGTAVAISRGKQNKSNVYIKLKSGAVYQSLQDVRSKQHFEIAKYIELNGSCPNVFLKPTFWIKVR